MPAVAIKISEELAEAARIEAAHADRSLTGQIEHWAKLGRGVEERLTSGAVAAVKRVGSHVESLDDPTLKEQILAAFSKFEALSADEKRQRLGLDQAVRFEPDPDRSGGIVRITPDGQRTRGTMNGRTFVPDQD